MQVHTTPIKLNDWDTAHLVSEWGTTETALSYLKGIKGRIEMELMHRMEADGAKEVYHPDYEVKLEYPAPTYDDGILFGLRELVAPEEWAKGYTPEHQITVPGRCNMTVVKGWRKFGAAVGELIERAKVPLSPGTGRLRIKAKEKKAC